MVDFSRNQSAARSGETSRSTVVDEEMLVAQPEPIWVRQDYTVNSTKGV